MRPSKSGRTGFRSSERMPRARGNHSSLAGSSTAVHLLGLLPISNSSTGRPDATRLSHDTILRPLGRGPQVLGQVLREMENQVLHSSKPTSNNNNPSPLLPPASPLPRSHRLPRHPRRSSRRSPSPLGPLPSSITRPFCPTSKTSLSRPTLCGPPSARRHPTTRSIPRTISFFSAEGSFWEEIARPSLSSSQSSFSLGSVGCGSALRAFGSGTMALVDLGDLEALSSSSSSATFGWWLLAPCLAQSVDTTTSLVLVIF